MDNEEMLNVTNNQGNLTQNNQIPSIPIRLDKIKMARPNGGSSSGENKIR